MPPKQLASLDLRFQGGLVFKAHRLFYHSILGLEVIKRERENTLEITEEPLRALALTPLSSEYGTHKTVEARIWT